ncbi:hypothetical protein A9Q81_12955 [Gammaproteobacteria bacterium 42_54_T18]|nr:hypothetical protein A9Q81_12955 [Gammaproteobacteria bacterium 42_54_T18]
MSDSYLIVPLELEVLNLPAAQSVISEMADFSRLPWSDGKADYNTATPYLGEAVTAPPFQNQNLNLSSGLHLHWLLPKALRTSQNKQGKVAFPAAPDRWLVSRTVANSTIQWVIESDYMSEKCSTYNMDAITVPVLRENVNSATTQPYMYLGRQLPLAEWIAEKNCTKNKYWKDVQGGADFTAMGYGEVSFSTFYPNCRSVFGLFDHEAPPNASYEVLGWYSCDEDDILNGKTNDDIESQLKWHIANGGTPTRSLYYGIVDTSDLKASTPPELSQIAVGNSGTEALSAYLANVLSVSEKPNIEDQLEAILLGGKIPTSSVDAGPNFEEARHQKGFDVDDAGPLWTLKKHKLNTTKDSTSSVTACSDLPVNLATLLDDLNQAQSAYNRLENELGSFSFHLYSDWYKYIMSCYPPPGDKGNYPDIDQLQRFISLTSLSNVEQSQKALGQLNIEKADGSFTVSATESCSKAGAIATSFRLLNIAIKSLNHTIAASGYKYEINHTPAPRFYSPSDPVVLFAADAPELNDRKSQESDLLTCITSDSFQSTSHDLPIDITAIASLTNQAENKANYLSIAGQWRPQTLEWLVSFFPVSPGSNVGSPDGLYQPGFINKNFALNEDCFDFTQQNNTARTACEYKGKTYVTDSASTRFLKALEQFILKRYPKLGKSDFESSLAAIWKTYPDEKQVFSNPGFTAVQAYQALIKKYVLTQSIGGFHLALLQHTNNLSMPIADPLGFNHYQAFTDTVASSLAQAYTAAPNPDALFMPIRSGNLSFLELAISDHFGRVNNATIDTVVTSNPLSIRNNNKQCWLGPRLAQPARINFRWLSAMALDNGDDMEMSSHPHTDPVIGWFMANYLEDSLMCYDQKGQNLGSFDQSGQWQPPPGVEAPITSQDLVSKNPAKLNEHLLNLLINMKQTAVSNKSYIVDLISAYQGAQQNIYPESYAGHDAISLLMGKPIAIVRTRINLEVKENLHTDQGWIALSSMMNSGKGVTANYEHVQFPLRLGEYKQLDDGLIGYWVENGKSYQNNMLFINDSKAAAFDPTTIIKDLTGIYQGIPGSVISGFLQAKKGQVKREDFVQKFKNGGALFDQLISSSVLLLETQSDSNIDYYADAGLVQLTLASKPVNLTMLMDPHGSVHASSGILPVKTIQLPAEYYVKTLKSLSINFFTAPIITPCERMQFSLPSEPGHLWTFLQQQDSTWLHTPNVSCVKKPEFDSAWQAYVSALGNSPRNNTKLPGISPWSELISNGWLSAVNNSKTVFKIEPKSDKNRKPLITWGSFNQEIEKLIASNTKGITPFSRNADLCSQQHILEGWLELTQIQNTSGNT